MAVNRRKRRRSNKLQVVGFFKKAEERGKKSVAAMVVNWRGRHPVFLFLAFFAVLMGLFYAFVIFTPFYKRDFLLSYLPFNAKVSGAILGFLGQDITIAGSSISSPRFSICVAPGCDGIEPIALFLCAVLAFPAPFLKKIPGIIAGTLLLMILNFVRVVSLFFIGIYFPKALDIMHLDVWQALFILFAVLFWIVWLRWVTQSQIPTQQVLS